MPRPITYLSVCSGIEAATVAFEPLGWKAIAVSEIEPFPSAVLAHHYPDVPNLGDMNKIDGTKYKGKVDIIVGGTPCQSFSVAGLRSGMEDPRGNLALTFLKMVDTIQPDIFIWENVPGVLSSNGGRDFGSFVGAVAKLRYRGAWRVLDAQYFGLAQRRKRLFFVGCSPESGLNPHEVLFEREGLQGDSPPSREKREGAAGGVAGGVGIGPRMTAFGEYETDESASTVKARDYKDATDLVTSFAQNQLGELREGAIASTLNTNSNASGRNTPLVRTSTVRMRSGCEGGSIAEDKAVSVNSRQTPIHAVELAQPLGAKDNGGGVFVAPIHDKATRFQGGGLNPACNQGGIAVVAAPAIESANSVAQSVDVYNQTENGNLAPTLTGAAGGTNTSGPKIMQSSQVRRLTPIECERLQGFPDGYTQIPWRGKSAEDCPDGPRYKALGNSMAVPVMRWIAERILKAKAPPIIRRVKRRK